MRKIVILFLFLIFPFNICFAESFSPSVLDCSSSKNLFDEVWNLGYRANNSSVGSPLVFQSRSNAAVSSYIAVSSSSSYTLSSDYSHISAFYIYMLDSNLNYINNIPVVRPSIPSDLPNLQSYTFITDSTCAYILFYISFSSGFDSTNYFMQLEYGSTKTSYTSWIDCSSPPPTPPSNNVYSSFITLYLDRINFLATNFTSNPYLLSMLGIIFSWIVLELLLHIIHIKGGYKK